MYICLFKRKIKNCLEQADCFRRFWIVVRKLAGTDQNNQNRANEINVTLISSSIRTIIFIFWKGLWLSNLCYYKLTHMFKTPATCYRNWRLQHRSQSNLLQRYWQSWTLIKIWMFCLVFWSCIPKFNKCISLLKLFYCMAVP